jgi:hypothetical protein
MDKDQVAWELFAETLRNFYYWAGILACDEEIQNGVDALKTLGVTPHEATDFLERKIIETAGTAPTETPCGKLTLQGKLQYFN